MESSISQKVFHSALIIGPPLDKCEQIQNLRKDNDAAYQRWMPHINLAFPFIEPEQFEKGAEMLQQTVGLLQPFKINFQEFKAFNHGQKSVLYLHPSTENGNEIQNLFNTITTTMPYLDDLGKQSESGYTPHLTCGQFSSNQIERVIKDNNSQLVPIQFECSEIYMISRNGKDDPFSIIHKIKLLG